METETKNSKKYTQCFLQLLYLFYVCQASYVTYNEMIMVVSYIISEQDEAIAYLSHKVNGFGQLFRSMCLTIAKFLE